MYSRFCSVLLPDHDVEALAAVISKKPHERKCRMEGRGNVKRIFQCIAAAAVAGISYWLYWKQFGSVPFLLISMFLFYKAYKVQSGRMKKRQKTEQMDHSPASAGKKAEIIT